MDFIQDAGYAADDSAFSEDAATCFGYLAKAEDAMLLVEATNAGLCRRIKRRLQPKELASIRSGAIFVFDELESNMKRWTDKLLWSPSRQVGNFFVYRQMTTKIPRGTSVKDIAALSQAANGGLVIPFSPEMQALEKQYVGSLACGMQYPTAGLIKKTLCLGTIHVISYFTLHDVQSGRLSTPSEVPAFANLTISPRLASLLNTSSSNGRPLQNDYETVESQAGPIKVLSYTRASMNDNVLLRPPIHDPYLNRGRARSLPQLHIPRDPDQAAMNFFMRPATTSAGYITPSVESPSSDYNPMSNWLEAIQQPVVTLSAGTPGGTPEPLHEGERPPPRYGMAMPSLYRTHSESQIQPTLYAEQDTSLSLTGLNLNSNQTSAHYATSQKSSAWHPPPLNSHTLQSQFENHRSLAQVASMSSHQLPSGVVIPQSFDSQSESQSPLSYSGGSWPHQLYHPPYIQVEGNEQPQGQFYAY